MSTVSKLLLLAAALLGTIPADNCLLGLSGGCCAESHDAELPGHSHDAGDDHDCDHHHDSDSHHHHTFCIVMPCDVLSAQTQLAPKLDSHKKDMQVVFGLAQLASAHRFASPVPEVNAFLRLKPPDPPLFQLTHAYLI